MSSDPDAPAVTYTDRTFRRVLLFFILILVVIIGVAVASLRNLSRSIATNDWVNHTHALVNELDALQPTLAAAEGELTRYLLTADQHDHTAYQDRFADLGEHLEVINALIAGSPEEKELFAPIASLLTRRAELATQAVRLKKAGDDAALQKLQADDADGGDHRDLARRIEKLREKQIGLLTDRDRASFLQAEVTRWTVLAGVGLDFLLLCGAAWLIRDDLAARRQAARLLKQTNADLEDKVRLRTAEISAVNTQLVAQNLEERWSKQALEHQNRYNLLIIDSIADAVFVVTKLMNISRMNPAAIHLAGFEPVDLVDRPLSRVVQLADHDPARTTYDPLARTLVDGHELRAKPAIAITKTGEKVAVELSVFPLRDRDKVVGGVVILKAIAPSES
jgi:PAS domain S-box-containing protein